MGGQKKATDSIDREDEERSVRLQGYEWTEGAG